ncbi:MAG: hypothetical protein VX278_19470, partial [Myxococcota bacterium]|nr:hypothetical protein [Myxococcota bacterium]
KSFYFPDDMRLDIMGQIGTEIQTHGGIQALLISGAQVMFVASETVRIYVEGNTYMKGFLNEDIKPFSFNTVTFGLKFRERLEGTRFSKESRNRFEAGIGTTIPAHYSYWRYHYGSITGDVNLFMD